MTEGPFRRHEEVEPPAEPPLPKPREPEPPAHMTRWGTWVVGIAVVLLLAVVTLNTIRTDAPGARGLQKNKPVPPFAAPLALSDLEGDANLLVKSRDGTPVACDVRGPRVLNACELWERGPVALAFLATRSERCLREIDVVDRVRARHPEVAVAAVGIRGSRDELRSIIRKRGWKLPVAHDRDGAVANAYAIAVCPTVIFVHKGGKLASSLLGEADETLLERGFAGVAG